MLEMPTPASQPSYPLSSPPGDDDDDDGDDNGANGNDNVGGLDSNPRDSPPPDNSSPHGGIGAALGDVTPPSASGSNKGSSKCPPLPRKPADEPEEEAIPSNHCKTS
jgi:hypothetical protein